MKGPTDAPHRATGTPLRLLLDYFTSPLSAVLLAAFVFLASPQCSSYITGEVLPIIGGY